MTQKFLYRAVFSCHILHGSEVKTHSNDVQEVVAQDVIEAANLALAAVRQLAPAGGVVLNLVLTVALGLPKG